VNFCVRKQCFSGFHKWDRYPRSTARIFVFLMHFGRRLAAAFRIVFDTLVCSRLMPCRTMMALALNVPHSGPVTAQPLSICKYCRTARATEGGGSRMGTGAQPPSTGQDPKFVAYYSRRRSDVVFFSAECACLNCHTIITNNDGRARFTTAVV